MFQRIIGIDPAIESKHTASILNSKAEAIRKNYKFAASKQEFDNLLKTAKADGIPFSEICIVCEPTSLVWIPIATYFSALGCKIYMIKPEKAAALRKFFKKHAKTDSIDSMTLAKMPFIDSENLYPLSLRSSDYVALERLCKQRDKLVSLAVAPKTRIRSFFQLANPGVLKAFEDPFSAAGRKFLRNYVNPNKVLRTGLNRLHKSLNNASRGQTHIDVCETIINSSRNAVALYSNATAKNSLPFDYEQLQLEVNIELDTMEYAEKQISFLESRIESLYLKLDPDETLKSLKGFGTILASIALSITGDINRFHNIRQYKAFSSMIPKTKGTSDTEYLGLSISKGSHPLLRKTYYMAAETARHWDIDFAKKYHECIIVKGMHHKQAICVLANMFASRVYSLLKRKANSNGNDAVSYQLRNAKGKPIDKQIARKIILNDYKVPKQLRRSTKIHRKRGKGTRQFNTRQSLNSSKKISAFSSIY